MNRNLLLFFITCLLSSPAFSGIKTAISNSSNGWSVASNWFPSGVPAHGDTIIIPVTFSLSVKGNIYNSTPPKLIIYVYGTLDFDPAGRIELADESEVYVYPGGSISTNGSSSERIIINGLTKFNGQTYGNISGPLFANASTGASPSGFVTFSVLPVKLVQFSHELNGNNIQLQWTILQETGILNYELERKRNNASWEIVQTNTLAGIAGEIHSKSYLDRLLPNGVYEYRLHFKDANGESQYSKTISLKVNQHSGKIKVYPNPAFFQLSFSTDNPVQNGLISLSNTSGKIVYQSALLTTTTSIHVAHLPKGMYTLTYSGNNERHIEMIMIR